MPLPGENIQSWSTTALDNGNADSLIAWPEGQTRASVNNSARGMMAAHAKDRNLHNGSIITSGTINAHSFISGVTYTAVPTGLTVKLKIGSALTNTGPATLNMDAIGAVAILDLRGKPLVGGELAADSYCDLIYNGTNWILLTSVSSITNVLVNNISNTVINAGGAGSSTIDLTGLDGTYDHYVIDINNLTMSTDGNAIGLQIGVGDPPVYQIGANYEYGAYGAGVFGGGGEGSASTGITDRIPLTFWGSPTGNIGHSTGLSVEVDFGLPTNADVYPMFSWRGRYISSIGTVVGIDGGGRFKTKTAFTAVRLLPYHGVFVSGSVQMWGIHKPPP